MYFFKVSVLSSEHHQSAILRDAHVACVFGNPIEQSKSPIIHELFAKQFDIALNYQKRLADVDAFSLSADAFFANPLAIGANVTMPFKDDALKWVDTLSKQARRAGAVNTIIRSEAGFIGDNSDGIGLTNDLRNHKVELLGANLLVIGAGGAAKGALPALIDAGVAGISLYNRSQSKALELIEHSNGYSFGLVKPYKAGKEVFDLVINATSLSLSDQLPEIPDTVFYGNPSVYDMVYKNQETVFLQHARSLGCVNSIDGLGMLIEQAAHSFYLWFGLKPNTAPVFKYLRGAM
ncbi:shikimate dehydrogenase [Glaciecola sp. SC05]|uniref:shikimate dehydrogenase n=1 Tax=Glaciecola sp. SC05 TaxID=1987355 RepID=UPI003528F0EE